MTNNGMPPPSKQQALEKLAEEESYLNQLGVPPVSQQEEAQTEAVQDSGLSQTQLSEPQIEQLRKLNLLSSQKQTNLPHKISSASGNGEEIQRKDSTSNCNSSCPSTQNPAKEVSGNNSPQLSLVSPQSPPNWSQLINQLYREHQAVKAGTDRGGKGTSKSSPTTAEDDFGEFGKTGSAEPNIGTFDRVGGDEYHTEGTDARGRGDETVLPTEVAGDADSEQTADVGVQGTQETVIESRSPGFPDSAAGNSSQHGEAEDIGDAVGGAGGSDDSNRGSVAESISTPRYGNDEPANDSDFRAGGADSPKSGGTPEAEVDEPIDEWSAQSHVSGSWDYYYQFQGSTALY